MLLPSAQLHVRQLHVRQTAVFRAAGEIGADGVPQYQLTLGELPRGRGYLYLRKGDTA